MQQTTHNSNDNTPSIPRGTRVVIFGGCGYVGLKIAEELFKEIGYSVLLADIMPPPQASQWDYALCDITNSEALEALFVNEEKKFFTGGQNKGIIELVIHLASAGMSGKGMLDPATETINVKGTQNIIEACVRHDVKALVYASSYNVVFGGQEIFLGESATTPYFPYHLHTDFYSRSKRIAEEMVLAANCANHSSLMTTSLRPAAIYGEGESRHFPRIVAHMDNGLFMFRIGRATVDWVHGDNLAQAFRKALVNLHLQHLNPSAASKFPSAAGKAYAISDGTPIDSFEFLRPVCEARKIPYPSLVLPLWVAIKAAYIFERIFLLMRFLIGSKWVPAPFLTRAEVYKVAVTHTLSIREAQRDFGYQPTLTTSEGAQRMGHFYALKEGEFTNAMKLAVTFEILILAIQIIIAVFLICFSLSNFSNAYLFFLKILQLRVAQN